MVDRSRSTSKGSPATTPWRHRGNSVRIHRPAPPCGSAEAVAFDCLARDCGGIGRRAGFRFQWVTPWGFESPQSHCSQVGEPSETSRSSSRASTSLPGWEQSAAHHSHGTAKCKWCRWDCRSSVLHAIPSEHDPDHHRGECRNSERRETMATHWISSCGWCDRSSRSVTFCGVTRGAPCLATACRKRRL